MQVKHLALLFAATLPIAACGTKALTPLPQQQILTGEKLNQADANFVTASYQIVQLDTQQGQLAVAQATDPQVRAIAGELIEKARSLYPHLEDAIRANGITAPTRLPRELQRRVDELSALHGRAFDRAYLTDQIESHQHAVAVFRAEQARTQDASMRSLVEQALPVVQDDLTRLQTLAAALR
jgi:putative membrane protein